MERAKKVLLLLALIGFPAAAETLVGAPPRTCFSPDATNSYVFSPSPDADLKVTIDDDAALPDLRVALTDRPESADFVLVDDVAEPNADGCKTAQSSAIKTIAVGRALSPVDLTISLLHQPESADYRIYVRSERFSSHQAAALFAVMRKSHMPPQLAAR